MTGAVTGWARLFCKRAVFAFKIKRICKEKGFVLKSKGLFWWLGRNKSEKCNFTIDCGERRFCVKIIGVRSKRILFGFIDENHYEIKDYTFALAHTMDSFNYETRSKEPYRFDEGTVHCIVMLPDSAKVTIRKRSEQKDRQEIGSRDIVPEGEFFFGKNFIEMIKELEN